jgi:hypothetical protein
MTWSTIRHATDEDRARLTDATDRFQARHNLTDDQMGAVQQNTGDQWPYHHNPAECARLHKLYRKVVSRALRDANAEGISYGYVGFGAR